MKKIGLLSVFNEPNYGSMLQAYALSKAISNMGYEDIGVGSFVCFVSFVVRFHILFDVCCFQGGV